MNKITEEWARTAPAGAELDRVVAGFMGIPERNPWLDSADAKNRRTAMFVLGGSEGVVPNYSADWSAAGPLLEAMQPVWSCSPCEKGGTIMLPYSADMLKYTGGNRYTWPRAKEAPLAIARACAVLVARGITRADLEAS